MASHCQRSILSCARCRRRKIKCDRQLPSCSQCIATKATCTGAGSGIGPSGAGTGPTPRSIVQHLESEIARLETALLHDGQLDVVHASDILLGMPGGEADNEHERSEHPDQPEPDVDLDLIDPALRHVPDPSPPVDHRPATSDARSAIIGSRSLQAVISATLPYEVGTAADLLSRVRMGLTPSTAKVQERRTSATTVSAAMLARTTYSTGSLSAPVLRSMPWDIVQRLMHKYLSTVQLDNPFLVTATVVQQLQTVGQILAAAPEDVSPSHDFLVVYLVLALAVTPGSANDDHEARCAALSVALFEEGLQHFYGLSVFQSELAWLQTILLVLLYATVVPRAANVWVLSGVAMRSCLEMGLHREDDTCIDSDVDNEERDLRRRVFWAAYCMDRSICSALQRPLSTPDAAIDARLPRPLVTESRNDPFLCHVAYNQLLSEMLHVHFHREPIPDALAWDVWLARMEARLQAWHGEAGGALSDGDFLLARGLMVLHRPSPRVPLPAPDSLLRAFEAAAAAERIHRDHLRGGVFRRPWLSAHYTLEAATVVLFCLRHGHAAIAARFTPAHVFDRAKRLTSNLLAIATHGWPEVGIYAGVYERLLGPLLERVFLRTATLDTARFGPAEDAELMRLLYPGPAHLDRLRSGLRQKQQPPSPAAEQSPFDFNLFLLDDDLPWNGGEASMGVGDVDGLGTLGLEMELGLGEGV
ncbi:hypothetical protein SEUCBS139899_008105 [Sporothrix eucalyptigena]